MQYEDPANRYLFVEKRRRKIYRQAIYYVPGTPPAPEVNDLWDLSGVKEGVIGPTNPQILQIDSWQDITETPAGQDWKYLGDITLDSFEGLSTGNGSVFLGEIEIPYPFPLSPTLPNPDFISQDANGASWYVRFTYYEHEFSRYIYKDFLKQVASQSNATILVSLFTLSSILSSFLMTNNLQTTIARERRNGRN